MQHLLFLGAHMVTMKTYWFFVEAASPVEWNTEYATLPLIASEEM